MSTLNRKNYGSKKKRNLSIRGFGTCTFSFRKLFLILPIEWVEKERNSESAVVVVPR